MQKSNYEKREDIFNLYANNLRIYLEKLGGVVRIDGVNIDLTKSPIYVCPLCRRMYAKSNIEGKDPVLTREHNPPKAIGGDARVLTCKTCNKFFGHSTDQTLINDVIDEPFYDKEPNASIDATFNIQGHNVPGKIIPSQNLLLLELDGLKKSKQAQIKKYITKPGPGHADITVRKNDFREANRSALKIAYLEMFAVFGYAFVFHENAARLRDAMKNPNSPYPICRVNDKVDENLLGMSIIKEPTNLVNYKIVVPFKFYGGRQRNTAIIIPGPSEKHWQNYVEWSKQRDQISFTATVYPKYQGVITNPECVFDYYGFMGEPVERPVNY